MFKLYQSFRQPDIVILICLILCREIVSCVTYVCLFGSAGSFPFYLTISNASFIFKTCQQKLPSSCSKHRIKNQIALISFERYLSLYLILLIFLCCRQILTCFFNNWGTILLLRIVISIVRLCDKCSMFIVGIEDVFHWVFHSTHVNNLGSKSTMHDKTSDKNSSMGYVIGTTHSIKSKVIGHFLTQSWYMTLY